MILSKLRTLYRGRGASALAAAYSAVVTLFTEAALRPRLANTARAIAAHVIGSPSLLML